MIITGQQVHARAIPGKPKTVTLLRGTWLNHSTKQLSLTLGREVHGVSFHRVWCIPLTCIAVSIVVHVAMITSWEGKRLGQQRGYGKEKLAQ